VPFFTLAGSSLFVLAAQAFLCRGFFVSLLLMFWVNACVVFGLVSAIPDEINNPLF
jgi:hypothetical protein